MKTQPDAALPLFASAFPLRVVGSNVWTRYDDSQGTLNNFVLASCYLPKDAEFVAQACNAHVDLLAALERLRCEACHYRQTGRGAQYLHDAENAAIAALVKAKGGAA